MIGKIFDLFNKAGDIASEAIEDVDKRNELNTALEQLKQEVYIQELQTKTIPWVDALHKMARPIISLVTVVSFALVIHFNPEVDIVKLLSSGGVAALYTAIKGRGN